MRIIRQSSYAVVPWKNGGGITQEAIRVPPGEGAFRWRVSLARIDASGPFSDFAGYRRYMVLLKGAGVALEFTDSAAAGSSGPQLRELRRIGDMAEFDGGLATHCALLDGPCMDLNLMVSNTLSCPRVRVEALSTARAFTPGCGESVLVLPIDAAVEARSGDDARVLEPWDLALLTEGDDLTASISAIGRDEIAVKVFVAEFRALRSAADEPLQVLGVARPFDRDS